MVDILAGTFGTEDERRKSAEPPAPTPTPSPTDAAYDKALGALSGAQQQSIGLMRGEAAEMAPARERALGAMRDYSHTADTELTRLRARTKDIPEYEPTDIRQSTGQWLMATAALGAIIGSIGRYHGTAALNAMGGMTQGWAQGNIVKFNQEYQTWKANADRLRINNERAQNEYNEILANKRLSLDQKMAEVQMIGAKWQDQIAISLAQERNIVQFAQVLDHREATQAKASEAQAKIEAEMAKLQVELAKLDPSRLSTNTPGGSAAFMNQIMELYKTQPQIAKLLWSEHFKSATNPPPDLDTALAELKPAEPNSPGWFDKVRGWFGVKPETAPGATPGAPGAPPPAETTPAATPPPTPAIPSGTQGPARQSSAIPVQPVVRQPGVAGRAGQRPRDGSTAEQAIILSPNRATAARQAATLKDGTWIVLPPDRAPVQIQRKGTTAAAPPTAAPPATQPTDVARALGG